MSARESNGERHGKGHKEEKMKGKGMAKKSAMPAKAMAKKKAAGMANRTANKKK